MEDFKAFQRLGQLEGCRWKEPQRWPLGDSKEPPWELSRIMADKVCNSLLERDVLAWGLDLEAKFSIALRYLELDM